MGPAASASEFPPHDCMRAMVLARLLDADDVDAALAAGLMDFLPCASCDAASAARLHDARQRLASAWAARDRYLARNARLTRRAAERDARRTPTRQAEENSSLPPSVAEVLARAKARAAGRPAG